MGTLSHAESPILLVMFVLPAVLSLWLTKGQPRNVRVTAFVVGLMFSWVGLALLWMTKWWWGRKGVE